jgi:hypothetical protein
VHDRECARCGSVREDVAAVAVRVTGKPGPRAGGWNLRPVCPGCLAYSRAQAHIEVGLVAVPGEGRPRPASAFHAKFPGTCTACRERFPAGTPITGRRGAWRHAWCPVRLEPVRGGGAA